jgi:hypothetical protein
MGYPTKIATCCYCGTRAALVLDQSRHELSCSSCGAPLHDMKRLPTERNSDRVKNSSYVPGVTDFAKKARARPYNPPRRKYAKKRKGLMRHLIEEAFDVIEDIFD